MKTWLVPGRRKPGRYGGCRKQSGDSQPEEQFEHSWDVREALRTRTLWLLIAGAFLASISTGGIAFHLVAYYTDVSIEPTIAAGALSLMALSGALGNGIWGTLAERVNPRALSIFTMCLSAAAVALLTQVEIPATAYLFAVLFGTNARVSAVLMQILTARYYGRRSYGAISSLLEPFHKGGLGLGALFAGFAYDFAGNYQMIFALFLACYLVSAFTVFLARPPALKSPMDSAATAR